MFGARGVGVEQTRGRRSAQFDWRLCIFKSDKERVGEGRKVLGHDRHLREITVYTRRAERMKVVCLLGNALRELEVRVLWAGNKNTIPKFSCT